jgi:hypothetical protein
MTRSSKRANDTGNQLTRIKESFSETVTKGVVTGLARRVSIDPRIIDRGSSCSARR